MTSTLPVELSGFAQIADHYDGMLCDIWGVVHNGVTQHAEAVDALVRFRKGGGRVVLITNAARPADNLQAMLDEMGVTEAAYDRVISSGDMTRALIEPYRGGIVHHVGPPSNLPMFEGTGVNFGSAEQAQAVVVTGLDGDAETPDDYLARMALWRAQGLVLVCANPDKVVERGDRLVYCPGALADIYEADGGKVVQAGKPHAPIYTRALSMLADAGGPTDLSRILAVGDSARTDATGAGEMGLDLLFITGSIHAAEFSGDGGTAGEKVQALIAPTGARLAGYMDQLRW